MNNITFRNYQFNEVQGHLKITKTSTCNPLIAGVQRAPCRALVPIYTSYLLEKREEFNAFNPTFRYEPSRKAFIEFRNSKLAVIEQKLQDPLKALQNKVTKIFELLFQKKGERQIILGCMHIQKGGSLVQTQTPEGSMLPRSTLTEESHEHSKDVCLDIRNSPNQTEEQVKTLLKRGSLDLSGRDPSGPDFALRFFSSADMNDFNGVRNVAKVHAERLPFFEKGLVSPKAENSNFALIERIYKWLAKGGVFSFDFDPCFVLFVYHQNKMMLYRETVIGTGVDYSGTMQNTTVALPSSSPDADVVEEIFADQVFITYEETQDKPFIFCSLNEMESDPVKREDVIAKCSSRKATDHNRLIIVVETAKKSIGQLSALNNQIIAYNALTTDPSLERKIHPKSRIVLDKMLVIMATIARSYFERIGFTNSQFDLNGIHPENGRRTSRIIRVEKR
jgi:hypothetical protein